MEFLDCLFGIIQQAVSPAKIDVVAALYLPAL